MIIQGDLRPGLLWAIEKCKALQNQGFDRIKVEALQRDFQNCHEGCKPPTHELHLDEKEVLLVQKYRAKQMTGYDVHGGETGYYLWPFGKQPAGAEREEILGETPLEAAEKFLTHYLSHSEAGRPFGPPQPTRRTHKDTLLFRCEAFISGFEGDESQEGIEQLLKDIRAATGGTKGLPR